MPFGLKKDKAQDEGEKRSALFGRSKSSKSPAPQANPYAVQPPSNNPYASSVPDPYAPSSSRPDPFAPTTSRPPPYEGNGRSSPQLRQDKSPVPPGGYGGGPSSARYGGANKYDQSSGYGSNPYGGSRNDAQEQPQSRYGAGGYGGLGRTNTQLGSGSDDAGRSALFGDAAARQQQRPPAYGNSSNGDGQPPSGTADQSYSNGYGDSSFSGGYGGYPDRELTAEEQEEEDIQAHKNQIRDIKRSDVAASTNARRIAEQTEAIGRETLARLGQQGERIHNAERNLDLANTQNRIAQEKAGELKTLNRSMFAVHVSNPFNKAGRERQADQYALEKHREDRAREEATRQQAIGSSSRQAAFGRQLDNLKGGDAAKKNLAQRSKFQFEADSEDEEMENQIDENLEQIHRSAKTLNALGKAMGDELDSQNKHITRITGKSDLVGEGIEVNRKRLDRIGK